MSDKSYIVVDDFGSLGRVFRETDVRHCDREAIIKMMLAGEFNKPVCVVAIDAQSCDASANIAKELVERAWAEQRDMPEPVRRFCEGYLQVPEIERAR